MTSFASQMFPQLRRGSVAVDNARDDIHAGQVVGRYGSSRPTLDDCREGYD